MKKTVTSTIIFFLLSLVVYCQEQKMDYCLLNSTKKSPCTLIAYKKVNDTLYSIAPINCESFCFDSTQNGSWKIFMTDSITLIEITQVENGKRNGRSTDFYSNKKIKSELIYWEGTIDQHVRIYYWDNGKIARYEVATSTLKGGTEYYNKEGQPIDAETFFKLWCR